MSRRRHAAGVGREGPAGAAVEPGGRVPGAGGRPRRRGLRARLLAPRPGLPRQRRRRQAAQGTRACTPVAAYFGTMSYPRLSAISASAVGPLPATRMVVLGVICMLSQHTSSSPRGVCGSSEDRERRRQHDCRSGTSPLMPGRPRQSPASPARSQRRCARPRRRPRTTRTSTRWPSRPTTRSSRPPRRTAPPRRAPCLKSKKQSARRRIFSPAGLSSHIWAVTR